MKKMKNNLDERQELVLLKIEHNGCWLAFWSLFLVIIAESAFLDFDLKAAAGEWIVFMLLAVYLVGASLKNGLWDRRLKPNLKTNLLVSLLAGCVSGLIMFLGVFSRFPDKIAGSAASGVFIAFIVFVLVFLALTILSKVYTKKVNKDETEEQDDLTI